MNLEGFSKKGMELGKNLEGTNETKNDLKEQYLNTIKRLALQKMKNDILFNGQLDATIRKFSSLGLDVSRESILKDIQDEIYRQNSSFDLGEDEIYQSIVPSVNNNQQVREPVDISRPIPPREPAIEPVWGAEDIRAANLRQLREMQERKEETLIHTEQEKQKIREEMQRAQEEIKQKLEWAKQQPNEPIMTFTGNLDNLSDDVKQKIIEQMEKRGEVIISEIDKVYQEGNYIVVDAKDNQGRFTGTEFTIQEFTNLVNQPIPVKKKYISQQSIENEITQQQSNHLENEKEMHESQEQEKNKIVSQIMTAMNLSGEFSFGDISMDERMSIMQNVKNKLNSKSLDELQVLLSTYQEQDVQKNMSNGMHK